MLKPIINPDAAGKKTFPKTVTLMFTLILFATLPLLANNVSIDGAVTIVDIDTDLNNADIRFDISWENSWRTDDLNGDGVTNWDAAWVFAKYRVNSGDWNHCSFATGGHTAPTGSTIEAVSDGMGVFIYRSANGTGSNDWDGAQLCWDYGTDGVADDATVDVKVFAIEMVYIPQGAYYAGDGMTDQTAYTEEQITSANASTDAGSPAEASGLTANYPNGYNAFWLQKHEVSQGQYADFLNNITSAQATARYPDKNGSYRHTITTGYSASVPDRACNYLSWADALAYADWAALRPMTELEYEKACRGDNNTASGSFAWGEATITTTPYTITNDGNSDATVNNDAVNGNAAYDPNNANDYLGGPLRCGIFADGSSDRVEAGATYYGVLEMSGNVWEHLINDDATAFTGELGDGDISSLPSSWPAAASGKGIRGGAWNYGSEELRVSSRQVAAWTTASRAQAVGFRAVRTAYTGTVPDAPSIGTATAGDTQADVPFTAPADNGGSTITSYTATSDPGSITGTLNQAGSGTITVTGLTNGTAYTFTVTATNSVGTSAASSASNSVTPAASVSSVTNPTTGEIWMDRNLGASRVAESSDDYLAYGSLFQWGRLDDGHQVINWTSSSGSDGAEQSNETSTLATSDNPEHSDFILSPNHPCDWRDPQNDNLWQGVSGTNNPCPSGYRLPTETEWEAERASWSSNNAAGAFASPLKLPVAGRRLYGYGALSDVGSAGLYWSSTVDDGSSYASYLYFTSNDAAMASFYRAYGYSVRCIKDD